MGPLRGAVRLFLYALMCALGMPCQWIALRISPRRAALFIPKHWHRLSCRLFGLEREVVGVPYEGGQVLIVSNHLSYFDIPVMSCVAPCSFVARADLSGWPLFGTLARLQQTVFSSRARAGAARDRDAVAEALREGRNLVIFPEGTSSDGAGVLPFRSSLLGAALDCPGLTVQPVTIDLLSADGRATGEAGVRDVYAWHGDMTLPPHLWRFACGRGARIRLVFHAPFPASEETDRKALARRCEDNVRGGLSSAPSKQGWQDPVLPVTIPPTKETAYDLHGTGSRTDSGLSAEQVRQ